MQTSDTHYTHAIKPSRVNSYVKRGIIMGVAALAGFGLWSLTSTQQQSTEPDKELIILNEQAAPDEIIAGED